MSRQQKLTEGQLAYKEGRENITLRVNQLRNRVLNEVLSEYAKEFSESEANNRIIYVKPEDKTLRELLRKATERELGDGS